MKDLTKFSISEQRKMLKNKEVSSVELTQAYLDNIAKKDGDIGAYLNVTSELALKRASEADKRIANGDEALLLGISGALKDNICTRGISTTCASKMLENFVPNYSATVAKNLDDSGYIPLGKLNMDEFAMGSSCENSHFKPTKNPHDIERVPGGSSGGSAASVAAYEAAFSLGSDTGGSIRQPAAFCGVVGMKPTYGTVSRYGVVAFASSLDQVGPLTRTVLDNALVLSAIASHDKLDATSNKGIRPNYMSQIGRDVKGLVVGLPSEFFADGISPEVKDAVMATAKKFESMGAKIEEIKLPNLEHALSAYYIISSAEASSNLARFDGIRYGHRSEKAGTLDEVYINSRSEGFGKEVQRRIMLGTFALSSGYYDAYYKKALQVRTLIMEDYKKAHDKCDFILSPVAPTVAYKLGEKTMSSVEMYMGDIYTVPINIAGLPSLAMPCAMTKEKLPIGVQLIGKPLSEQLLYGVGHALEQEIGGTAL